MIYHNAVKRILTTPVGSDRRSAERVSLLCRMLAVPHKGLTVIKIMGQSGKSACAAMLSRALLSRGYRVGTLTTPFSHTMTECITVDCAPVSMDTFTASVSRVCDTVTAIRTELSALSENSESDEEALSSAEKAMRSYHARSDDFSPFADELLLAAALLCFSEANCQVAVIEVPAGDRAEAYRLPFAPTVSVITTTEDATVAARICRSLDKRTRETVSALQSKAVYGIISDACAKINCRLTMPLRSAFYPADFAANRMRFFYKETEHTLHSGAYYQALNLLTVSETLVALHRHGLAVDPLAADFQTPFGTAGIELQFSFLSLHPTIITDFADTPSRVAAFAKSLTYHTALMGTNITLITEQEDAANMSDEALCHIFTAQNITINQVVRTAAADARRTIKPIIKALTSDDTLFIIGSRPFVYETTRILRGLMA